MRGDSMGGFAWRWLLTAVLLSRTLALPPGQPRQRASTSPSLEVDVGYEIYRGYYNATSGLNEYKGIRYAASPDKGNRWRPPYPPKKNRESVIPADRWPQRCPQGPQAPVPASYNYTGTEDCLFLSVFAAPNATDLPVFVWIHGGGYGAGQGNQDLGLFMGGNDNGFVGVVIQYRLGAFGFLAGDEVHRDGVANAGLLDQHFALQWVQEHIHLFGGDRSRVTIAGVSAGGGSAMLQSMAYGGTEGTKLFSNIITSSPYLPTQYGYADWRPSQAYYAFALAAGCFPGQAYGGLNITILECLRRADTALLQKASFTVGASGTYGTWAFIPVTDGDFLRARPTEQLLSGQLNGLRVLSGNNANEGPLFTIQNITTKSAFEDWTRSQLPLFSSDDIDALLRIYPGVEADDNPLSPRFATTGTSPPYALSVSSFGTGSQQRANNLYAETTFVCSSYWLAQGFSRAARTTSVGGGGSAYLYQYSVPAAWHGADLNGLGLRPATPNISPAFMKAFIRIWGNFIIHNNPSIDSDLANGNGSGNGSSRTDGGEPNPASAWPPFSSNHRMMINLNETGGTTWETMVASSLPNVTQYQGSGLRNDFSLQDAWEWEGGRGYRCDFWASRGAIVPE